MTAMLVICLQLAMPAGAITTAVVSPSLRPNRLGAKAAFTFTVMYAGREHTLPSPVRRFVLRLPAGLSLYVPKLRICPVGRLRAHGARGCPNQAQIGRGHALVETYEGSQILAEEITLRVFLGPIHDLQPTFEILGQGYTPLDERVVFTGRVLPVSAPYGEELILHVPPIRGLPFEANAAIVNFSLTIGASGQSRRDGATRVVMPSICPIGGFPFAAEFTYADGSSGGAQATAFCPP